LTQNYAPLRGDLSTPAKPSSKILIAAGNGAKIQEELSVSSEAPKQTIQKRVVQNSCSRKLFVFYLSISIKSSLCIGYPEELQHKKQGPSNNRFIVAR
jgi:hypothetical protein